MSIFDTANKYIPGGVNSPVRAFKAVDLEPIFIEKANKSYLYDINGKEYIDYVCSWGPLILGHNNEEIKQNVIKACENGLSYGTATKLEVDMAQFICENITHIEKIRMVNSGTEAVMSAIRLARGYTGKDKVVKFDGCYHGHSDSMLIQAGSGLMTEGIPDSSGVTKSCTMDTISIPYNNLDILEEVFKKHSYNIACVILEPVAANMGVVLPNDAFLKGLRQLCDTYKSLLIFDEVITGFRLSFGGASEYFGITPDLVTYGKIIGAGMPVGAYGGKKEIMDMVAPNGAVYQAGTLSGNPIAMTAGLTQLKILKENESIYSNINNMSKYLFENLKYIIKRNNFDCTINYIGSLGSIFFTREKVFDYMSAKKSDTKKYAKYFKNMLDKGVYIAPAQFEAIFISNEHNKEIIDKTLNIIEDSIKNII
ncbi:glutamate-1-semialdehyde 2,1-aminomutase [uncultured Tyzzerella sp.]|uniref:glutamate-1-semialdehyde 2,1-aminomutase n=1 Tax=uncultured Tyzzerella sp. TaxID=2321398 RepID=UPI0029438682|nr:glutamate-1-semialdehyde 2,1-aminomutase [uncultured Tyzzerella sp.]